jgi:hypothetical protein
MHVLDSLIRRAEEKFQFTAEKYPELVSATPEETLRFAIRHSVLHYAKTAGKIAAHSEDVDHGGAGDLEALKTDTAKSLLNALRLAGLLGMNGAGLVERIDKKLGDPINQ